MIPCQLREQSSDINDVWSLNMEVNTAMFLSLDILLINAPLKYSCTQVQVNLWDDIVMIYHHVAILLLREKCTV